MAHYFTNNQDLISEIKELKYSYLSFSFTFLTDNGVFSKKHIDYGSKLLVESYLKDVNESYKVLDVGCGYGFLGIVISVVNNSYVDMIDINKRAVHLAKRNAKKTEFKGNIFESDAYSNITSKYDVIITNPPIRAGREKVLEILLGSFEHLNKNGRLYFVIRKKQGAKTIKKILEEKYKVEILIKEKGYFIFKVTN